MIRILRKTDYKITITLTILLTPITITPNHIMNLPTNITIQTQGMDTVNPNRWKTGQCVSYTAWTSKQGQLYKIQEVLRHPSQYRDRIKPEDHPAKGKYGTAFNKFCPKKVEVNEATVEEAIKYGQLLRKSEEDIAEAIDIYKALGNKTFYGLEENTEDQPEQQQ